MEAQTEISKELAELIAEGEKSLAAMRWLEKERAEQEEAARLAGWERFEALLKSLLPEVVRGYAKLAVMEGTAPGGIKSNSYALIRINVPGLADIRAKLTVNGPVLYEVAHLWDFDDEPMWVFEKWSDFYATDDLAKALASAKEKMPDFLRAEEAWRKRQVQPQAETQPEPEYVSVKEDSAFTFTGELVKLIRDVAREEFARGMAD